jgi:hypothetical protein
MGRVGTWNMDLLSSTELLMNGKLLAERRERFDEASIDRRKVELASTICSIWPDPVASWHAGPRP